MQRRLESSLSNLFDISQGPRQPKQQQSDDVDDVIHKITSSNGNGNTNNNNKVMEDAPKLDQDFYLNSEKYMNEDGSIIGQEGQDTTSKMENDMKTLLIQLMDERPSIPEQDIYNNKRGTGTGGTSNPNLSSGSLDDKALLEALSLQAKTPSTGRQQQNQQTPTTNEEEEELHRRVFANEQGFLDQSEAFRQSLQPDSDNNDANQQKVDHEAIAWRRGADYRRRQEESLAQMEIAMAELEASVLTIEEAKLLAMTANQNQNAQSKKDGNHNNNEEGDQQQQQQQQQQPMTILCSKCSCLMTSEEIQFERKKGRPNSNEMICRLCQVETTMSFKNGSPFLMGRLGRNNKPPPRAGIAGLDGNDRYRQKTQQIRNIGPRTEEFGEDGRVEGFGFGLEEEQVLRRTPAQSNAWRAQFTAAMTQRNGVVNKPVVDVNVNADVDADASVPVSVRGVAKSPVPQTEISRNSQTRQNDSVNTSQTASASMDPTLQTEQNENVDTSRTASMDPTPQTEKKQNEIGHSTSPAKSVHHRYSNRTKELKETKNQYVDNVWYAHCKAALHRQQSIELTGTAYQDTSTIDNANTEKNKILETRPNPDPSPSKQQEVQELLSRIKGLEGSVDGYKHRLEKSSKQVKALQSVIDAMSKSIHPKDKKQSS